MTRLLILAYFIAVLFLARIAWSDDGLRLDLAKCFIAECGARNEEEMGAIGWILKKGAKKKGKTFHEQVRAYCACFSTKPSKHFGKRRATIRAATLASAPVNYEKQWPVALDAAAKFLRGEVDDPCPRCTDWGNPVLDPRVLKENWHCPLKYGQEPFENWFCFIQR
jgi:hypothetical protein